MYRGIKGIIGISIHIFFWGMQLFLLLFAYENLSWNGFSTENGLLHIASLYGMATNIVLFYFQFFWLVPGYFVKKSFARYLILTAITALVVTSGETYVDYLLIKENNIAETEKVEVTELTLAWAFSNGLFNLVFVAFGFLFRFPQEYFTSEKAKQELLKETHKTELKYLKAQLNPHFLFNGINSVYHLIGRNDSLAKNTLLQFSGLLRYQLYESNTAYITLEKELEYISQYIQLEEVRKGDDINLDYDIGYENPFQQIAPLLLIPFVENAFKHVSNHAQGSDNIIHILIEVKRGILYLSIKNTYDGVDHTKKIGGLGLNNVRRRLELIYPGHHQLSVIKNALFFAVNLKIEL